MSPLPCSHCGNNFMRHTSEFETEKLCNNCFIREESRKIKKEEKMDVTNILITVPSQMQKDIEEICIKEGLSFGEFFISLYETYQNVEEVVENLKKSDLEKNDDKFQKKVKK